MRESSWVTVEGVRLHCQDSGGPGTPTVLLHGGGPGCCSWLDFAPVLDALGDGRRLLLFDLAQYGRSDAPAIDTPAFSYHAALLGSALTAVGLPAADFVCQSLGGSVAIALAARYPGRVRRLVITGSAPVPYEAATASGPAIRDTYYGGDGPTVDKMRTLLGKYEWFDPAAIPEPTVRARHEQSISPAAMSVVHDPARRGKPEDLTDALARNTQPTLLLWGAHDPFAPPGYAVRLAERLPDADVHVLSRTSHHPQEERPAAYAAAAAAFLN